MDIYGTKQIRNVVLLGHGGYFGKIDTRHCSLSDRALQREWAKLLTAHDQ